MRASSMTLKHVLVIPYVILILIAGIITGIITWYYSSSISTELGNHIVEQTSLRIQAQLDNYLSQASIANNYIKNSYESGLLDITDRNQTLGFMTSIIQANPTFSTLQVGYPNHEYVGIGNTQNGTLLHKSAGKSTNYDFYVNILPTGSSIKTKDNFAVTERAWYKEAVNTAVQGDSVWSSIYIMSSSGKPGVSLSEALYDKDNTLMGVVGTDVVFRDLNRELYNIKLTDNSLLFIVDEGQNKTNKQNKLIAQSILENSITEEFLEEVKTIDRVENNVLKQSYQFIHNQKHEELPFYAHENLLDDNGKLTSYFISYIPYKHDEGLNWYIGIVIPESDYLGSIYNIQNQTVGMWLLTFLLALLLGLLITHYINENIKGLQNKLSNIEDNGSMYEHNAYPIKEINSLSKTFSIMSHRLYESYIELQRDRNILEQLVYERTEELEQVNIELQKKSHTDTLTGLTNRNGMEKSLANNWHRLKTGEIKSLTLIMCDLDFFKQYNDTYKHQKGDEALVLFAQVIQSSIRETDIAIRYGGEEFLVILPNATANEAIEVAQRIQQHLTEKKIQHKNSMVADYMTTSIGIASTSKDKMTTEYALIHQADTALYLAKSKGRNCYVVYDPKADQTNLTKNKKA